MSSTYSPWNTSSSAGASLEGTLAAGGDIIGPIQSSGPYEAYPAELQQEQQGSPFANQIDLLGQLGQQMAQSQQQPEAAIQNYSINAKTGMAKIEIPQSALAEVMGQLTDLKTMKTAAMARVAQLRQQEASGSPLLDALSQFAGNMASNDPTMPGWVRALGQTNLQMGSQGIKRERMAEEQRAFAYGKELSDTSLAAMRFSELEEARREKREGTDLEERRVAVLEQNAKTSARNTALDNFRADMTPVLTSARQTGLFTPEHETAIRSLKERHPDMSDTDIEREINLAKGTAKAAFSEKERVQKARAAEATAKAGAALNRVAAANGMRVNTLVQTEQVKAGARQASAAKVDAKEAARIEGLHNLAADVEGLEKDNWWQGVISGKIAQGAPLTTEQQMLVATRARAFVSKMQTMGLSFAKTSEKEMEKILATVPQPGQTQGAMKQLMALMDRDARRAAAEIGEFNWGETTDSIAQMFPARYVDSAVEAHQRKLQSLTPQQRMGLGIINGDDDEIAAGLSRISGSTQPQNSTRPGEIRMATPGGKKRVSYEDYVK